MNNSKLVLPFDRISDQLHTRASGSLNFRELRDTAGQYLPPNPPNPLECSRNPQALLSRLGGVVDQLQQHRSHLLLDAGAPPEQRLAAVRELSKSGTSNLTIRGNDGQNYNLRLEREAAGSREMLHLYITAADGTEHVVLRGIANQNGQFEREQDAFGNYVGWYGSGLAKLQNALSADSPDLQRRTVRGADLESLRRRLPQNAPIDCRIDPRS